jgi:hypothetical protein
MVPTAGDFCNQESEYTAYSSDRSWRSLVGVLADRAAGKQNVPCFGVIPAIQAAITENANGEACLKLSVFGAAEEGHVLTIDKPQWRAPSSTK